MPEDTPIMSAVVGKMTAEGKPAYPRNIEKLNDTADPVATIRNALSAQYDQNAMVVLAGPATNLAAVMDLPGSKELIAKKVKHLCISIGAYPDGPIDKAVQADIAAARKLFSQWPTPILAAGSELGEALPFPAASLDKEFAWTPTHPFVDAYKAARPMPYDAPSASMIAALAGRPSAGKLLQIVGAGHHPGGRGRQDEVRGFCGRQAPVSDFRPGHGKIRLSRLTPNSPALNRFRALPLPPAAKKAVSRPR